MNFAYFFIWIGLCLAVGLGIGFLRGNLPLGISLIPLLLAPFAYVFCYDVFAIVLLVAFVLLAALFSRKIWRIWRKKQERRKHPRLWISIPTIVLILVIYSSFLGANTAISALLVPEFMNKLDAFEEITDQSYSQLVQDDKIDQNHRASVEATNEWLDTVDYEKVGIQTTDGYQLNGYAFYASESTHNWVLIAHGYTGWKEEMYPFAYWYSTQGFNSLVPDCRCSGSSEGDYIGMGYTDSRDMLGWIDLILQKDPQARIILHGQSMGGSTVLQMAGLSDLPDQVVGVVSDCAYSDTFDMFQYKGCEWTGMDLPEWMLEFVCFTFRLRGGYDIHASSPRESIKNSDLPILFIHGDQDKMVPVEMAYELYDAYTGPKDLLIVEGSGHAQNQDKDPDAYYGAIQSFLAQLAQIEGTD